jgi:Xaa-Pro aminopeptidase
LTTAEEYAERHAAVQDLMRREGWSHLLVVGRGDHGQRGHILYLTGHKIWDRWAYLLLGERSGPTLVLLTESQRFWASRLQVVSDVRRDPAPIELVVKILKERLGPDDTRLGVVGLDTIMSVADYRRLVAAFPSLAIDDASEAVERIEARKTASELQAVDGAARIADAGYRRLLQEVGPGKTEWELNAVVQHELFRLGAFDTMPLTLQRAGEPYLQVPQDRPYAAGVTMSFSLEAPSADGYWIELARMISLGEPDAETRAQVDALHEAHRAAASALRPGVLAGEIASIVEETVARRGYRTGIWLGHGIGLDLPAWPPLVVGDMTRIERDWVIAMHPHLIDKAGQRGAYVADTYVVTADGARALSTIPLAILQPS